MADEDEVKVKVLKELAAIDGCWHYPGEIISIRADHLDSLVRDGFVEDQTAKPKVEEAGRTK